MGALRVVLADDHVVWRSGVRSDLGDGFEVVGEAATAPEAIETITSTSPDVVLCDLQMPGGGISVVRACAEKTAIVMLTVSEAERDLLDAVSAGAVGYLTKLVDPQQLRDAVRKAALGEPVFTPGLALLVLGEFRRLNSTANPGSPITDREREVLQLVARGHTYRQAGAELFIAERTVESHVRNILAKLHLTRREDLARYAADHGIT